MKLILDNGDALQVEDFKVLDLKPGDVVVLNVNRKLPAEQRVYMMEIMNRVLPKGVKLLVLELGMSVEVLRNCSEKPE